MVLGDVAAVKVVHDPSLPDGHAFWVELHSLPPGTYFVAGAPAALRALAAGPCNSSEAAGLRAWRVGQRQRRRQRAGWMRSCSWRTWQPRRACLRCAGRLRLMRRRLELMMLLDKGNCFAVAFAVAFCSAPAGNLKPWFVVRMCPCMASSTIST